MTAFQVRTFTPPRALGESLDRALPENSSNATPRVDGVNGSSHTNGTNGVNGVNGINGVNGVNGNAKPPSPPKPRPSYPRVPPPNYGKMASEGGGITFASQDSLPTLPIPDLEQTTERYLKALKPLQSPREQSDTRHAVNEFLKNEGHDLNEKLKKYAQGKTSYIEQFCEYSRGAKRSLQTHLY